MSTTANLHIDKASQLYQQGRVDDAINELNQAILLDSDHVKSYLVLARIYEANDNFDRAVSVYRQALKVDIDNPHANLGLGVLLSRLGRYDEALMPLRMAWSNDRENPRVAMALGNALECSGDLATAQAMYEEALRLSPEMLQARYRLAGIRYAQQKYEAAIAQYVTYMISAGDTGPAHRNIGKALLKMGKVESATRSLEMAKQLTPEDPEIYFNLGRAYILKDNYEAAIESYKAILTLAPDNVDARYGLAKAHRQKGNLDEAAGEYRAVVLQSPRHYRAMNGLANCFLISRDYQGAADLLREAVAIAPDYDVAHHNLGIALKNLARTDEATFHFSQAQRLNAGEQPACSQADNVMQLSDLDPPQSPFEYRTYVPLAA